MWLMSPAMDWERKLGLTSDGSAVTPDRDSMVRSLVLRLSALGCDVPANLGAGELLHVGRDLFARYREQSRLLSDYLPPVDRRIQRFLDKQLGQIADIGPDPKPRLPSHTLILDRHGLARELAFPVG